MKMIFSESRITELRETWGLSVGDFAKKVKKSRQVVSAWEIGATKPTISSLLTVCEVFDVPINFFIVKNDVSTHQGGGK